MDYNYWIYSTNQKTMLFRPGFNVNNKQQNGN